jgi:alpha-ribazole phosphatase
MNTLYLIRHSLTEANEKRLYCGKTDLPLSDKGRSVCHTLRDARPLPECELYVTSGMRRAEETLHLLSGRHADIVLPELKEMDFGLFEMRAYAELCAVPEYIRWIEDAQGDYPCPDGECVNAFRARVLRGGERLLRRKEKTALAVCHGGVIVQLMQSWFPNVERHFYEWQPQAGQGYRIAVSGSKPTEFDSI